MAEPERYQVRLVKPSPNQFVWRVVDVQHPTRPNFEVPVSHFLWKYAALMDARERNHEESQDSIDSAPQTV